MGKPQDDLLDMLFQEHAEKMTALKKVMRPFQNNALREQMTAAQTEEYESIVESLAVLVEARAKGASELSADPDDLGLKMVAALEKDNEILGSLIGRYRQLLAAVTK
jgi:hypothetical protein